MHSILTVSTTNMTCSGLACKGFPPGVSGTSLYSNPDIRIPAKIQRMAKATRNHWVSEGPFELHPPWKNVTCPHPRKRREFNPQQSHDFLQQIDLFNALSRYSSGQYHQQQPITVRVNESLEVDPEQEANLYNADHSLLLWSQRGWRGTYFLAFTDMLTTYHVPRTVLSHYEDN